MEIGGQFEPCPGCWRSGVRIGSRLSRITTARGSSRVPRSSLRDRLQPMDVGFPPVRLRSGCGASSGARHANPDMAADLREGFNGSRSIPDCSTRGMSSGNGRGGHRDSHTARPNLVFRDLTTLNIVPDIALRFQGAPFPKAPPNDHDNSLTFSKPFGTLNQLPSNPRWFCYVRR
ncbi:hypothetical protein IHE45_13G008100 [Dioscorea alata]|uniref:Uncharacterized protein n=1 Tax=Dioscorea alata TaxID=55571 RepID=A0ACB7UW92_DIOAL|nr:hypothetical protein IHE45_13G008100 [Dioscorea alata]